MNGPADLTAPWEARVFAIADQLRRSGALDWDAFQAQVAARAPEGSTPRYDDWLWVLERQLTSERRPGPRGPVRSRT